MSPALLKAALPPQRTFPTLLRGGISQGERGMQQANDRKRAAWLVGLLLAMMVPSARADDWPQWLGPKRDGVWRENGILDKFPPGGPKELWRAPVGGGYAGPAVAGGKVYLMDRQLARGVKNPDNQFSQPRLEGSERI